MSSAVTVLQFGIITNYFRNLAHISVIVGPLGVSIIFEIYKIGMDCCQSLKSTILFLGFLGSYTCNWDQQFVPMVFHGIHLYPLSSAGLVATIYNDSISKNAKFWGGIESWTCDLKGQGLEIDWNNIWANIFTSSKNPAHQLIHWKLVHKFYLQSKFY